MNKKLFRTSFFKKILLLSIFLINLTLINSDNSQFSGPTYQSLKSSDKMDKLWEKINEIQTPHGWYSRLRLIEIFFQDVKKTFTDESDAFLDSRKKIIHSVGLVGKVELVPDQISRDAVASMKYKGIFKGCKNVLLRLSVAKQTDESKSSSKGAKGNFAPGLGIKFLRTKVPSANVLAMYGVEGQNSWNFFKNEFSNHIPSSNNIALKLLAMKFSTAQPETEALGLKTLSKYDEDGNLETDYDIPYRLIFRPAENLVQKFKDDFEFDYIQQIKSIEVNSTVYELYAVQNPEDEKLIKIGNIVLRTPFITSEFGDKNLFFQHNFISYDKELHSDWHKAYLNPELYKKIHKDEF